MLPPSSNCQNPKDMAGTWLLWPFKALHPTWIQCPPYSLVQGLVSSKRPAHDPDIISYKHSARHIRTKYHCDAKSVEYIEALRILPEIRQIFEEREAAKNSTA